jgi:ABC-2 type transport system ATP-binding protein
MEPMRGIRVVAVLLALAALGLIAGPAAAAPPPSRDAVVTSFDGTKIVISFFPADDSAPGKRRPTVMMGPGWSQGRAKDDGSGAANPITQLLGTGVPTVRRLRAAGYNVLTWDPRGFGESGGNAMVDGPDSEGRDAQKLIDYIAEQPEALLDAPGDPRLGMAGASYGGGIQWVVAALDSRIDVIAPTIAWNSLTTSLYKEHTFKGGWGGALFALGVEGGVTGGLFGGETGSLDPHVVSAYTSGAATGRISADDEAWFASRGPGDALIQKIKVPAFINQGTVDTLFTLQEAARNYAILRRNGIPVKLLWFCGGHGLCRTETGDPDRGVAATMLWFKRYLDGVTTTDTGPRFDWIDQDGRTGTQTDYPLASAAPLVAEGSGTLPLVPGTTVSGAAIAQLRSLNAVNVTVGPAAGAPLLIQGAPQLTLTYTATGAGAAPDTRVYAHVVDDADGVVLGNQTTPIPILLDGREHTITQPLEIVSATAKPGETFTLQVASDSTLYDIQRAGGAISFSKVHIELPVADPSKPPPGYGSGTPAATKVRLRIARIKGNLARRTVRTLAVVVTTSGGQVRNVRVRVRGARGRILGASAARTFGGSRTVAVRLRRTLPAGRYTLEAIGRRPQDGALLRATKRFRRAAPAKR